MKNSKISWTHHTFNPWCGCVKIEGPNGKPSACDYCYADAMASRLAHKWASHHLIQISTPKVWGKDSDRLVYPGESKKFQEPLKWDRAAARAGERRQVFCLSMGDIMERNPILGAPRQATFKMIEATPNLDWLLLTKRPQEFRHFLPKEWLKNPRHNVWLLTTIERSDCLWRLEEILKVPAVVHGVSMEPLFEAITLPSSFLKLGKSAWVITGGESGPKARYPPQAERWYLALRDQAIAAGVPFHFKQWGAWGADGIKRNTDDNGRVLDGRTWDEYPEPIL
jgi:protein gp37